MACCQRSRIKRDCPAPNSSGDNFSEGLISESSMLDVNFCLNQLAPRPRIKSIESAHLLAKYLLFFISSTVETFIRRDFICVHCVCVFLIMFGSVCTRRCLSPSLSLHPEAIATAVATVALCSQLLRGKDLEAAARAHPSPFRLLVGIPFSNCRRTTSYFIRF